jgi:hypothetical protein
MSEKPISPLRQRMMEDMSLRNFGEKTRNDYIRHVKTFTAFLGRSPDTATAEDLRRFQLHQRRTGVRPPTMNGSTPIYVYFTMSEPQILALRRRHPRATARDLLSIRRNRIGQKVCNQGKNEQAVTPNFR